MKTEINIIIPENFLLCIKTQIYLSSINDIVDLLRKYADYPEAIKYIADMIEE